MNQTGVYIHVPFCSGKCVYCTFYSIRRTTAAVSSYLGALETELAACKANRIAPATIYIGGGTPSVLSSSQIGNLLESVRGTFVISGLAEWTVEANPGTLARDKLALLKDAGVNRISLGVQSFNDRTLGFLGRRHDSKAIRITVDAARSAGFDNIGLDLIAAVPGVTTAEWESTLKKAIEMDPSHISVYCLSIDAGAAMHRKVQAGLVKPPSEPVQMRSLRMARDILAEAGYRRYEISNYARPGMECRHNLAFWRGNDYLGFGPAASSRLALKRWTNLPDLSAYVSALSARRRPPRIDEETLRPETDTLERLAFAFRLVEGVDLERFRTLLMAPPLAAELTRTLQRLKRDGLLQQTASQWIPTAKGLDHADHIAREIIAIYSTTS